MSVNGSTRQVRRVGLLEDVARALETSGLDPAALMLEITETVLVGARDGLVSLLGEIEGLGVSLALDDFGTGYSSLSLLQDLPVQTLKIDRTFVGAIGTGTERIAFVRAIVDLAEALGLTVIGEGIETAAHVSTLLRLGCRIGQGSTSPSRSKLARSTSSSHRTSRRGWPADAPLQLRTRFTMKP